jgi:hypothetical protein
MAKTNSRMIHLIEKDKERVVPQYIRHHDVVH